MKKSKEVTRKRGKEEKEEEEGKRKKEKGKSEKKETKETQETSEEGNPPHIAFPMTRCGKSKALVHLSADCRGTATLEIDSGTLRIPSETRPLTVILWLHAGLFSALDWARSRLWR